VNGRLVKKIRDRLRKVSGPTKFFTNNNGSIINVGFKKDVKIAKRAILEARSLPTPPRNRKEEDGTESSKH